MAHLGVNGQTGVVSSLDHPSVYTKSIQVNICMKEEPNKHVQ